jgi:soluble lytic murein transglycosylase
MKFPSLAGSILVLLLAGAPALASDLSQRRGDFRRALEIAERGPLPDYARAAAPFAAHPLAPYLEYAHLRRQLDTVAPAPVERFLARHATLPIADTLRQAWLHALIRRKAWRHYTSFYVGQKDATLRCGALHARLVQGMDAAFLDDALALWLSGESLPGLCDMSFLALKAAGRLDSTRLWQRIDLAVEAGNLGLVRFLARSLPGAERARAESYAAFLDAPDATRTTNWPRDARSAAIATRGLRTLAQRDPAAAEALFAALATPLKLDAGQRGEVLNQIALWSAASYLPGAAARFARVPAAAFDERLHEWRAREALARNDATAVLAAIAAMPDTQRADPRWRYLAARMHERAGNAERARAEFARLAQEPNYHGFLAADRIEQPYALCPLQPEDDAATRARVAALPGLVRALELHALQREPWARREWDAAVKPLSPPQRRLAVALADDAGWYDRAVFTLTAGEDLRHYALRFPLPHATTVRAEAKKYGLDPGWVAALIRAESAWQADARSHANARGLMQLLPATARDEAKKRGIAWHGEASLYRPPVNLALGTAHLDSMLTRHGGHPYLATAAYNAGPTPVARWLAQRAPSEPDLWIETIPYRETREYVARILAFSVIYDWRLHGKAVPVSRRMLGDIGPRVARRAFTCPLPDALASQP